MLPQSDLPDTDPHSVHNEQLQAEPVPENPDLPPESFWVPKDQELDWLNRNAFMERKGSTKINSFSSSLSSGPRHSFNGSPSQRLSFNSRTKSSIIGLPTSQKSCFANGNLRRSFKPEKATLFRSQSEQGKKPAAQVTEPGSPRVSCIGRVRSRKGKGKKTSFWTGLRAIFRAGFGMKRVVSSSKGSGVEPETSEPEVEGSG